ncbi:MAG: tetratricopeptide repeat protein [Pseudomonadota bacterium]
MHRASVLVMPMASKSPPPIRVFLFLTALMLGCSGDRDPRQLFVEGEFDRSFSAFEVLADKGDIEAANYLGMHYYLGFGTEKDFIKAAAWFHRAALLSQANAQQNLGVLYLRGWGVEQDLMRAYGWLFKSYQLGNQSALPYLQVMSDQITPNHTLKAREWVDEQISLGSAAEL